jgi:hypothetical protein
MTARTEVAEEGRELERGYKRGSQVEGKGREPSG